MPVQTRWLTIASSIKDAIRAGELNAGAPIPSESELAGQWSVSRVTVHRALSELQREGWVVRRRHVGTVVADRSAEPLGKIGLVFSTLHNQPQSVYLSGIEDSLAERYQILPASAKNDPQLEARRLEQAARQCNGIICYPTGAPENTPLLQEIAAKLPVVFVDRIPAGIVADVVMTDNYGSIRMGLSHLESLGHTRIAYFMGDEMHISSVQERYDGFRQFMIEAGHRDPDRWIRKFPWNKSLDNYFESIESALAEMLSDPEPMTAVACQQDAVVDAVLEAAMDLGVRVPDDLAVLSFKDFPSHLLTRGVDRLMQRSIEMGNIAARRIQLRLADPALPPREIRLMADFYPARAHDITLAASACIASRINKRH